MKLRTQLIVAFLLLAVLPLAGITVYSYISSLKAFRKAVEAEADEMAHDMRKRMETVRHDLDLRVRALEAYPLGRLLAPDLNDLKPDAEKVYSEFLAGLGDTAPLIESLELQSGSLAFDEGSRTEHRLVSDKLPQARSQGPADSLVIYLPGLVGGALAANQVNQEDSDFEEISVRTAEGNRLVLRHRTLSDPPNEEGADSAQLEQRKRVKREAVHKRREIQLQVLTEQLEAAAVQDEEAQRIAEIVVANDLEGKARKAAEQAVKATLLMDSHSKDGKAPRLDCLDFDCSISVGGNLETKVKAQVNAPRVFKQVLTRTETRQGEIAFAIDRTGEVYAPSPADLETLQDMDLVAGDFEALKALPEEWLLVARQDEPSGITFGVARPVGEGLREIRQTSVRNLGYGLGMVGLAILGILPLSRRMTRNLTSLTDGAEQLARGNLETRVPVQSSDEFGQLAMSFNRMAHDLKLQQENLVKQERLQKELEMCHHIQKEMLPSHPLHLPFAEIHGVSIPAREVGGDFFNYFCLEEHKVALLIGDVSGKGVPAALLMANIQATLRAKLPLSDDLSALMKQLDDEIDKNTPSESYLTLFVAILDGQEKTLRWVNAGHNTQYILKEDGKLEHLSSTGRPVGLLPGGDYEERVVSLDDGDSIFLYTDGLVEAENGLEQEFGDQRLETLLLERRNEPSEALLARVEHSVCTHRGARETHDDATMVILKTARA